MDFPGKNLPLPHRPFPFDFPASALPTEVPDCHLVRTAIPRLPSYDSLGVFHDRVCHSLSLFCKHGFKGQYRSQPRPRPETLHSPIPTYSRKAGYAAHSTRFCAPQCRFYPVSYAVRVSRRNGTAVAQEQVSTESGSVGICHYTSPGNLNPQHPP